MTEACPVNTQQSARQGRRPGLCFACGKPGHWRGAPECPERNTNNKISNVLCTCIKKEKSCNCSVEKSFSKSQGVGLKSTLKRKMQDAGVCNNEMDNIASNMASYLLQSRAGSTTTKYKNCFTLFEEYCKVNSLTAQPAKPIIVAMYIVNLLDQGKSYHVISSAFYAIKWVHKLNELLDPTESSIVQNLLETAKRIRSTPTSKKDVVDTEMLKTLCSLYENSVDVVELRDLSMILLGYAGFLRFNELSNLLCKDIGFKIDHLNVKIQKSKTDIYRSGKEVLIAKGSSVACPYLMLQRYMTAAHLSETSDNYLFKPAFRSKGKSSLIKQNKKLSYTRAKECIVKKLKVVAPNLKLGTHSLRASGASMAANASGVSDRCLKRHGRWKSDQAKDGYIEDSLEKRLFITKTLKM
ncbi:uncharacterized protein LOC123563229 isoform X2 [Mercenaria mercenaria]|uniref:uncharacterized protein LOC123563229 isoform X2 n=1 Tax=Mercenaria mercenaria TaxID=6596 RepID=UPI001E1DB527|nr:uncharacterized protein LOC123563229 isoform X2 [Mercenaria mercenaria]